MMEKFKSYTILILAIIIAILILLKGCGEGKCPDVKPMYQYDTLTKWDTVKLHDTLIKYKTIYYPKEVLVYKTPDADSSICKTSRYYNDSVYSKNATIYYKITTIGKIKSIDLSANLTDRIQLVKIEHITKTEYLPSKYSFYGGFNLIGNKTSFDAGPYLTFNFKRNSLIASYNMLNQQIGIGVGYKFWNSKK